MIPDLCVGQVVLKMDRQFRLLQEDLRVTSSGFVTDQGEYEAELKSRAKQPGAPPQARWVGCLVI